MANKKSDKENSKSTKNKNAKSLNNSATVTPKTQINVKNSEKKNEKKFTTNANNKKTKSINLSQRTTSQLEKLKSAAKDPKHQKRINTSDPTQDKQPSKKTQALAEKIKQDNYNQIQKEKYTNQNKNEFNLKKLEDNNGEISGNENVSGIIKKQDKNLKSTTMNNKAGIKANVIGKKSDIKVIANKHLVIASVVLAVLFLVSLISNFVFYSCFKFRADNPPINFSKEIRVEIGEASMNLAAISVPRNIVTNIKVRQNIEIFSYLLNDAQVVRAKGYFTSGDGELTNVTLEFDERWLQGEDGYFYFNRALNSSESFPAVKFVTIPQSLNLEINGKNLNVFTIVFESLNHNPQTVNLVWTSAPQEWLEEIF